MKVTRAAAVSVLALSLNLFAAESATNVMVIDLPAALQLAGARNLDVQIARERLAEAKANRESATWLFVPAITPGVAYRRHDDLIQDVGGRLFDVHKDSYSAGPTISMQVDIGEAIYRNLASKQLVRAAEFGLETERQNSTTAAAFGYFDLAKAHASARVAEEAVRIANDYVAQLDRAVGIGVAFKGDQLRAQVQLEKNRLTLRQAAEQQAVAGARLAQALHLQPELRLSAKDEDVVTMQFVATNLVLTAALAEAAAHRPELQQNRRLVAAARENKNGAKIGPWIPSLGAQAFLGGLGGGNDSFYTTFGHSEDYAVTLGWRIGPNGLFDQGRIHATESRLRTAELTDQKGVDEINREVTETFARWQSLADQISTSEAAMRAAEGTFRLTRQRKEFGVGAVLEDIVAEQDLTRARLDHVALVAEFNKAQFALLKAMGNAQK